MAESEPFNLQSYGNQALAIVVTLISIAIAFGIGQYIIVQLNEGTNNSLDNAVNLFNTQASYISMAVTFLFIGLVAAIGIGLVNMLRNMNK